MNTTTTYNLNARQTTNNGWGTQLWQIFDGNVLLELAGCSNKFASRAECRAAIASFKRDPAMRSAFGL